VVDEILIISPELSPAAGGVGDYALRLLENWPQAIETRILTAQEPEVSLPYRMAKLGKDSAAIREQLPKAGGAVLVQYSAYGYDRHGFPRQLIRALVDWKKATGGRLVVMYHEIWTFWPITNKNYFVQLLHRRAIRRLLRSADEAFTSTESQATHLKNLGPHAGIHLLPVGSNIRRVDDVDRAREPGLAVIFGRQATRIRALRKMRDNLVALANARVLTKIVSAGAGAEPGRAKEEHALLEDLHLSEGFEQRGQQTESQISALLLTAFVGIFAQDQLSVTKSGTFMAYAAHQLSVLADFADKSKPEPVCCLVATEELLAGLPAHELKRRAEALLVWQKHVSSWKMISETFTKALGLEQKTLSHVGASSV
jgi:hypothetical protein